MGWGSKVGQNPPFPYYCYLFAETLHHLLDQPLQLSRHVLRIGRFALLPQLNIILEPLARFGQHLFEHFIRAEARMSTIFMNASADTFKSWLSERL